MSALGPGNQPVKVLVADADQMTAHLLANDLRREVQFQVIQSTPDASCISDCINQNGPVVLLLGMKSPEYACTGLGILKRLRSDHPTVRSIVLIEDSTPGLVAELFRSGAKGVFNRADYELHLLCRCICCVSTGQIWANSQQLGFVLDAFAETASLNIFNANGEELLTRREKDVVRLVAEGFSNREIAQELSLSTHTIKNYLFNIFEKLGVSSRAELVMYVLSNGDSFDSAAGARERAAVPKRPAQSDKPDRNSQPLAGFRAATKIAI